MKTFAALLKKELIQEFRSKEVIIVMLSLALLMSVFSALGVQFAILGSPSVLKIAPLLIWICFIFSATTALGRSFELEMQFNAVDALRISGVNFSVVYLAKVVSLTAVTFFSHLFSSLVLLVLLDLSPPALWSYFLLLSFIVAVAYSALAVLFSAVAAFSRLKGLILPLILLPLLFPLFMGALESTNEIIFDANFKIGSFWLNFNGLLMVIYLALGVNLYPYVLDE